MASIFIEEGTPPEEYAGASDRVWFARFRYDPDIIQCLKEALRQARWSLNLHGRAGGWSPNRRAWWIEDEALYIVRHQLEAAGHRVILPTHLGGADPAPGPAGNGQPTAVDRANLEQLVKSWYREMIMHFHPDRTLDNGKQMSAINHAYERLRQLLAELDR